MAATASLARRTIDPIEKLKETRGIVTLKVVPDNFEVRRDHAKLIVRAPFEKTKDHVFRDTDPATCLRLN
jgi:hypothetical protein